MKKRTVTIFPTGAFELDEAALEHEREKERARKRRVMKQEHKQKDRRQPKRLDLHYDEE